MREEINDDYEDEEDDYDDEVYDTSMPIYGEEYEILLLEPYEGKNVGDIITVYRGVYNTLIELKKALPVDFAEEFDEKKRLVMTVKDLNKSNNDYAEENAKLFDEINELKEEIKRLRNILVGE